MRQPRTPIDRRRFLVLGAEAAGVMGLSGARPVAAVEPFTMSTAVKGGCATCNFWGGVRKISKGSEALTFEGRDATGWCNKPDSLNYHTRTSPETGPMASWQRWGALESS